MVRSADNIERILREHPLLVRELICLTPHKDNRPQLPHTTNTHTHTHIYTYTFTYTYTHTHTRGVRVGV